MGTRLERRIQWPWLALVFVAGAPGSDVPYDSVEPVALRHPARRPCACPSPA
jgi:hypothetical protein